MLVCVLHCLQCDVFGVIIVIIIVLFDVVNLGVEIVIISITGDAFQFDVVIIIFIAINSVQFIVVLVNFSVFNVMFGSDVDGTSRGSSNQQQNKVKLHDFCRCDDVTKA